MSEFMSFKTAKKLKEKGYPQNVAGRYSMVGACYFDDGRFYNDGLCGETDLCYTAPTISQVLKWLREEKKLHVGIEQVNDFSSDSDGNICEEWAYWSFAIYNIGGGVIYRDYDNLDSIEYQSYEEAALAGLEYVLDNLI